VLRAVLEPRGLQVDRVRGAGAEGFAANRRPSVVVLHMDDEPAPPAAASDEWSGFPRVLIGTMNGGDVPQNADEHYLEKPFHYGDLIRAVEQLLAAAER
jgi:hypothetical protein